MFVIRAILKYLQLKKLAYYKDPKGGQAKYSSI